MENEIKKQIIKEIKEKIKFSNKIIKKSGYSEKQIIKLDDVENNISFELGYKRANEELLKKYNRGENE